MGRHHNSYTAAFKLRVINYADEHGKRAAARHFNVHEKCVRNWCMQREKLSATNGSRRAFRGKKSQYPSIENKIIEYICEMRKEGFMVTREMCQNLAVTLAEEEGIPPSQFKASEGWFRRMIQRNIASFGDDLPKPKRQKELAAQREAGLTNDNVPEVPNLEEIPSSVQQSSSVINDPIQSTSQDSNVTELVTREIQNINSTQAPITCVLPVIKCTGESSSTSQKTFNKDPFTLPLVTTTETYTLPGLSLPTVSSSDTRTSSCISQNVKSSQITVTSAVVKDQCTLPIVKNKESLTLTCSTKKYSSTIPLNNNFSEAAVASATVKDNCTFPVTKTSVKNSSLTNTVSNNDPFTLPLVSSTETYTLPGLPLPVVSSSVQGYNTRRAVTNIKPSILPVVSIAVKDTVPKPPVSCARRSIATQINFNDLIFTRTGKKICPSKRKSTGPNPISAKPLPKLTTIQGRRIIDLEFFLNKIKMANKHSKFGCNLNNMFITKEKKVGICTSYVLKCVVCDFQTHIWSDNPKKKNNLNSDLVSGMLSINCSFDAMNKLLTKMCLPKLTQADFAKERDKILSDKNVHDKIFEDTSKNMTRKPEDLTVQKNTSFISDNRSLLKQVDLGGLLVEDQFEIKEENIAENDNDSEAVLPSQTMRAFDDKSVDQEQATLNLAIVKQEIPSDVEDEELNCYVTDEIEMSNKESFIKNNNQSMVVSSQLKETGACKNKNINQEQVAFDLTIIKQEINSDLSDEKLPNSIEQTNLPKNVVTQHTETNNRLVESEIKDIAITNKVSISNLTKSKFNNEETTMNKKIKLCDKGKIGNTATDPDTSFAVNKKDIKSLHTAKLTYTADVQGTPSTVPSTEKNVFQNRLASNVVTTAAAETSVENVTASSSTTGMGNVYLIPMQSMPASNGNSALIIPQVSHAGGTFQDAQSTAFIPQTSMVAQQNTGQSNGGLLPLAAMHQSWTNSFPSTISNPLIIIPGINGTAYVPQSPAAAIQGSVNSSNVPVNASGITYIPIAPATSQQPTSSSNVRPPSNADDPRWIGRENMNTINPSCTLPGGAPKGVSDPVSPKSSSSQAKNQSKRPRFRCDDCDINFPKPESLDSHKKSYCVKRFKLPPSSTVTSHTLTNDSSQPTCVTPSFKTYVEELLSAMAIKRSFLESSMKTAIDAQYVINLHKSAQDLTQKTFKELDDALKKEKALTSEASVEQQKIVSEARTQALIRAEAAYKQEKHSAAAVEQALYRQKAAIEASLTATEHEQTALVFTLRSLKEQVNQGGVFSTFQTPYSNICDLTIFNQKELLETSLAQSTKQQKIANSTSSESIFDSRASSSKSSFFMEQRSEAGVTSPANVLQNVMHFDVHSEKLSTFNLEENKAIILNVLPNDQLPQPKQMEETSSNSSSNATTLQNYQKRLSPDYFHPQKVLNSNVAISAETNLNEYKNQSMSQEFFHSQKCGDERIFSENNNADTCFTQHDQAEEMLTVSATSSSKNIEALMCDVQQNSVLHDFSFEKRKVGDSSYTIAAEDSQNPISLSMIQSKSFCTDYS